MFEVVSKFNQKSSMGVPGSSIFYKNQDIVALQHYKARFHQTGYATIKRDGSMELNTISTLLDIYDIETDKCLGWYQTDRFWTLDEWRNIQLGKLLE
jgi:hypothetical protein